MPLEPSIILSGKTPEIASPLQTVGGLMALRGQMSDIALRNQQIEASKQQQALAAEETAQKRRNVEGTQKLQTLLYDQTVHDAIGKGDFSPLWKAGISPDVATPFIKNIQDMQTTALTLQKDKAAQYASGRAVLAKGLQGLDPENDTVAAQQYEGLRNALGADHPELAQQLPPLGAGPNFRQQLKDLAATNGVSQAILENQAGLAKEKAETARNQVEADTNQFKLDLMKGALNGTEDQVIDQRFAGHPDAAQLAKTVYREHLKTGSVQEALKAVDDLYTERIGAAKKIEGETDAKIDQARKMIPVEAAGAGAKAQAEIQDVAPMLSPEGLSMAAEAFAKTGQLPPMGMGKAGAKVRADIINMAAKLHPALDLASAKATYTANADSLKKLQANTDQVTAFEATAGKNIDLLLSAAKPIIDSNSPLLNKPLRTINQKALGDADLAAFNAARQVAINEIAKVTSNPGLSGQLSDSARREVESFIPQDATIAQIVKVASTLKQDMKNRLDSNKDQLQAIKDRLKGIEGQHPAAAQPSGHVIELGGKHYRYNGSGDTADIKNYTEVSR